MESSTSIQCLHLLIFAHVTLSPELSLLDSSVNDLDEFTLYVYHATQLLLLFLNINSHSNDVTIWLIVISIILWIRISQPLFIVLLRLVDELGLELLFTFAWCNKLLVQCINGILQGCSFRCHRVQLRLQLLDLLLHLSQITALNQLFNCTFLVVTAFLFVLARRREWIIRLDTLNRSQLEVE